MPPTLEELGIDKLPVPDRISLAQDIWDSIATSPEPVALSDAQRCELERRLRDHEANPDAAIPWEQVKAEALARLQK